MSARLKRPAPRAVAYAEAARERELPTGWTWKTVGQLAADEPNAITDGPFGSKLKTEHYTQSGPRVIRLANIGDAEFVDTRAHISESHYSTLMKHRVLAGDIVIAALGETLPRACMVPDAVGPAIVKADCIRFKPSPEHSAKISELRPQLGRYQKKYRCNRSWCGPSSAELCGDQVIVTPGCTACRTAADRGRDREAITRLEAGVAALRRVQANLKRYRAAVLKAACEGRLVPTEAELARRERRSHETGEQLLARILTERRRKVTGRRKHKQPVPADHTELPPLPDGWTWASLDELSWASSYGTSAKCAYESVGPPVLRIPNIAAGRIDVSDLKFAKVGELIAEGDELALGDLLIIRTNGSKSLIGRSAVVREKPARPTTYASYLIRFRLAEQPSLFAWLSAIWDCGSLRNWIERRAATSAGQHNVSMSVLSTLPIPLPPVAEQERIVAEVERRLSVIEELDSVVSANLQRAIRLRQSILSRAFSGRLVSGTF